MAASSEKFDIIMIAPPQYQGILNHTLKLMSEQVILADKGQLICQHDTSETDRINWADFEIKQHRKYGNTTFTILTTSS